MWGKVNRPFMVKGRPCLSARRMRDRYNAVFKFLFHRLTLLGDGITMPKKAVKKAAVKKAATKVAKTAVKKAVKKVAKKAVKKVAKKACKKVCKKACKSM